MNTEQQETDDFHVDYDEGDIGQAILEDPLIQAYFKQRGVTDIRGDSLIPISLAMAVYGNHAQLGESGLIQSLPNLMQSEALANYFEEAGIKTVTPQTMIPVGLIYLSPTNI
jgi:hypothetical protein